jgi:hypothetical protein
LTVYVYIDNENRRSFFTKLYKLGDNYIASTLIAGFENESGDDNIHKSENMAANDKLSDRCNPTLSSDKLQYKAKIGGVEYPQHVPIHFNRSIDFECLNNNSFSKRMPLILFWNKFYGNESFYFSIGKLLLDWRFFVFSFHLLYFNFARQKDTVCK